MQIAVSFSAVQHNAPLQLSSHCKAQGVRLIDSWRADSQSFSMAPARNYPMCENSDVELASRKFVSITLWQSSSKEEKRENNSAHSWLGTFSHSLDPLRTSRRTIEMAILPCSLSLKLFFRPVLVTESRRGHWR
jgi:hypothetical protein